MNQADQKLLWAKNHPHVCFYPYSTIDLREGNNGIYSTCCCNLDVSKIQTPDANFTELKKTMEAGQVHPACYRCANEEKTGGNSERVRNIITRDWETLNNFVAEKNCKDHELRIMFSSLCGLACRSCASVTSSTYDLVVKGDKKNTIPVVDLSTKESYWTQITNTIQNRIDHCNSFSIRLLGGEPLLQPGAIKLLNWLIQNKLQKKVIIELSTSLASNFDKELLNCLVQFPVINFSLSIDSVGENYTYVRWPAKFEKIERNFNSLLEFAHSTPGTQHTYLISPVFSLNNIFYLPDYLDYWYDWFETHSGKFVIGGSSLTANMMHIDFQALPIKYRSALFDVLNSCKQHKIFVKYQETTIQMYNFILATEHELTKWPNNNMLWNAYLDYTAEFDRRTNTQLSVLNSRLYNLLDPVDQESFKQKLQKVNPKTEMLVRDYSLDVYLGN
jgi:organic radical activating enzyme